MNPAQTCKATLRHSYICTHLVQLGRQHGGGKEKAAGRAPVVFIIVVIAGLDLALDLSQHPGQLRVGGADVRYREAGVGCVPDIERANELWLLGTLSLLWVPSLSFLTTMGNREM